MPTRTQVLSKSATTRIQKQIEIVNGLLDADKGVHPFGCTCAIMSRKVEAHLKDCLYRKIRLLMMQMKSEFKSA